MSSIVKCGYCAGIGGVHQPWCSALVGALGEDSQKSDKKADDRSIAQAVIETAHDVVMKQRQNQHGDAGNSFMMIANLWSVYVNHAQGIRGEGPVDLTPADVAFMMDLLKTARATYGDGQFDDHYVDKIGYTSLAAMLKGAKVRNAK